MQFRIDSNDARPIYIQIVDEVRRAIVIGTLAPDEPLPSVRQLAVYLKLNPNTVSQAYRELEREGLVYVLRGQGTFISKNSISRSERKKLAVAVAKSALQEAHRSGISGDELIAAIQELETSQHSEDAK